MAVPTACGFGCAAAGRCAGAGESQSLALRRRDWVCGSPPGWQHTTHNAAESWAAGRQRPWRPALRLAAAEGVIDPAAPAASPLALLSAGSALKVAAGQRPEYIEQAVGMLLTAAGLAGPAAVAGAAAAGTTSVQLRAQLALLDEPGRPPPHWAGPRGLAGARPARGGHCQFAPLTLTGTSIWGRVPAI